MNVAANFRLSAISQLLHNKFSVSNFAPLAVVAALAGGCAVDQNKEIASYRTVLDGQNPAAHFEVKPGESVSLEAALLLANRNSEQLALSGEDYVQALIDRERAFSAFLPTISLAPTYNWSNGKGGNTVVSTGGSGGSTFSTASRRQYTVDVPVTARQNIFNGFQDLADLRRSKYTADQRRALLLDLQQTVLLDVATTYYQILSNERSVEVLKNSVAVQDERVRDMEGRQRAGVARPTDVAQTQAQASATRVQLIQAQNNLRNARQLLAYMTDSPVQESPLSDRLVVPTELPTPEESVQSAEQTRQDAQATEAAIEAGRQNVQAAIGQYYPSVTLNLNYFLSKQTIPTATEWTALLQTNLPIFTGGLIQANVRTAWSQLRQAWLSQRQVRRLLAEQVRVAYENLKDSERRIAELHTEAAAAREALRQAESSYSAGLGTNLERITAQDQYLAAQLSLAAEEFNYKVYYLNLQRAMGRLPLPQTTAPAAWVPTSQPSSSETTTPGPVK